VTVVGLGVWCDYVDDVAPSPFPASEVSAALEDVGRGLSFRVEEFATLVDGRRITLHTERGFSSLVHVVGGSIPVDQWRFETVEQLEASVRTTVLPDADDPEEEHPWEWLAELIRGHGVDTSPGQLKRLPYVVEFSQRLLARVRAHAPT